MKTLLGRLLKHRHGIKARTIDMVAVATGIGVARLLTLFTAVLVARFGGAATFGEYSLFMTVFVLVSETPSALDATFIRQANSPGATRMEAEDLLVLMLSKLLFALALCGLALGLSDILASYLFGKEEVSRILRHGIIAGAIYSVGAILIAVYQKRREFINMSLARILPNLFLLVAVGAIAMSSMAITGKAMEMVYIAVSVIFASVVMVFLVWKTWRSNSCATAVVRLPAFYRVGVTLLASGALYNLTARLDVFFLTPFITFHELGIYGAAVRYSSIAAIVASTISSLLLPKAPPALGDRTKFDKYLLESIGYLLLQGLLILALILFIEPLVGILFGKEFISMKWLAILLFVQVMFSAIAAPFQALLQSSKRVATVLHLSIARLLLAIVFLKFFVPSLGVMGGAIAMAGSTGLFAVLMMFYAMKYCRPPMQPSAHGSGDARND